MKIEKQHIPSLNGIRALAVLLVFFSHAGFNNIIPGGLGVTVFFFLSGYLITTLLLIEKKETNSINFKSFYLRRAYRIFPPVYVVLLLVFFVSYWDGSIAGLTLNATLSKLLHFSNYQIVFGGIEGFIRGMDILWSLAVEEHFYLFFPVVFFITLKHYSLSALKYLIISIILVVLLWRITLVFHFDILSMNDGKYFYTYYATDTRIDSILFGCLMATSWNPLDKDLVPPSGKKLSVMFFSGIALILLTLIIRNNEFRETIRYTIQGIALFPLFFAAISYPKHILFKVLNTGPMKFIGKISYGFYLSHHFLIYIAMDLWGDNLISKTLGGFLLTMIFSSMLYFLVEKYFYLKRKKLH